MQIPDLSPFALYFLGALGLWAVYCVVQFSKIPTVKVWEVIFLSFLFCLPAFLIPRISDADILWFVAIAGISALAHIAVRSSRGDVGTLGTLGYLRIVQAQNSQNLIVRHENDLKNVDALVLSQKQFKALGQDGKKISKSVRSMVNAALSQDISIYTLEDYLEERYGYIDVQEDTSFQQSLLLSSRAYRFFKKVFDTIFAVLLMTVLSPIFVVIAIAVMVFDGKPVFYRQERLGKGGQRFEIVKFRTMDNQEKPTRLGVILRNSHIDELPQLLNVIRGEMALVGPRPEWVQLTSSQRAPKNYWLRQAVRPGLTGWAQVNYRPSKNRIMRRRKLGFDLYYIQNRSFFMDALIYLRTLVRLSLFWKGGLD